MAAMARRKISNRGRVIAAGLCLGATGILAGLMAATDDTGNASAGTSSRITDPASQPASESSGASSYDGSFDADGDGRVGDPGDFSGVDGRRPDGSSSNGTSSNGNGRQPTFPQPVTRSGGS
jgi:hypothetical protein